jgi:hypothetical protein
MSNVNPCSALIPVLQITCLRPYRDRFCPWLSLMEYSGNYKDQHLGEFACGEWQQKSELTGNSV